MYGLIYVANPMIWLYKYIDCNGCWGGGGTSTVDMKRHICTYIFSALFAFLQMLLFYISCVLLNLQTPLKKKLHILIVLFYECVVICPGHLLRQGKDRIGVFKTNKPVFV